MDFSKGSGAMRTKKNFFGLFTILTGLCLMLASFGFKQHNTAQNSMELLNAVLKSISNIKTLRYDLQRNERVKGKMNFTESKVKLQISPRKLYIAMGGQEVLWIQGANKESALINPGTFPYVNLNLDPMGSLMRKNQHHTIHELGMDYLAEILKNAMKNYTETLEKHFVILGEEKYMGRTCYKLSIAFPDFEWRPYLVKKNETILSIANNLHVSEFMILEKNPEADWYNDVVAGQVIQVPNAYAKLFLLMIDKELMLPISEKIYDYKGLFETYEFYNLKVNTPIAAEEFSENYKDYHF
ncbi:MAG: DUF1571 domain-containing protein [Bacteroidetes bacterium]|nr:DUF1571 domain-containing protein [Bacteroidota bacterium]